MWQAIDIIFSFVTRMSRHESSWVVMSRHESPQEQLPHDDKLAAASLKDKLQLCAQGPQSVGANLIWKIWHGWCCRFYFGGFNTHAG